MTLDPSLDRPAASDADAAPRDSATAAKPLIPSFRFPFSPGTFAPAKTDSQSWQQKTNNRAHEKKIGPAPSGTRRSMGKR